jgi:bisanhydrobacterioruberin hydratase
VFFYSLLWLGGVLNHLFLGGVEINLQWLGSLFLFLSGAILFLTVQKLGEAKMLAGFALFGFVAEVCGVYTGIPFGSYDYTDTLGWRIFGVPVVMSFAWMALILYVREMLLPFNLPRLREAALAALLITFIDLVIDPVAVNHLDYWRWENIGVYYNIPLTNFAGWFVTAFTAFCLFQRQSEPNAWRFRLGLSIVLFFTLLAFIYKLYIPALIGCVLCAPNLLGKAKKKGHA